MKKGDLVKLVFNNISGVASTLVTVRYKDEDGNITEKKRKKIVFVLPVEDIPEYMPYGCNPRERNLDKQVYKDVRETLVSDNLSFESMNHGLKIVCYDFKIQGHTLIIWVDPNIHGVADGKHTHECINLVKDKIIIPQRVSVTVICENDKKLIALYAEGLNKSVHVSDMSHANNRGDFDWIKDKLKSKCFYEHLQFVDNDIQPIKFSMLLKMMNGLNPSKHFYPITPEYLEDKLPNMFSKACNPPTSFYKYQEGYKAFLSVFIDMLEIYDYIKNNSFTFYKLATETKRFTKKFLNLLKSEKINEEGIPLYFINKTGYYDVDHYILYSMLVAYRYLTKINYDTGKVSWNLSKKDLYKVINNTAGKMLVIIAKNLDKAIIKQEKTKFGYKRDNAIVDTFSDSGTWDKLFFTVDRELKSIKNKSKDEIALPVDL